MTQGWVTSNCFSRRPVNFANPKVIFEMGNCFDLKFLIIYYDPLAIHEVNVLIARVVGLRNNDMIVVFKLHHRIEINW